MFGIASLVITAALSAPAVPASTSDTTAPKATPAKKKSKNAIQPKKTDALDQKTVPAPAVPIQNIVLPDWVFYGTPADALRKDWIAPEASGRADIMSGTGDVTRAIDRTIGVSMTDYGKPGSASAVRGLGRSVEETSVESLGVPLNYGGGGGFDLSVFPTFMWTTFAYQPGPSLGAYDPRASAGVLSLNPWTADQIRHSSLEGVHGFASQSYSTQGQSQTAGGVTVGHQAAVVAGYSSGDAFGPSGSFSIRTDGESGKDWIARFHLLASSIDAASEGSTTFKTPGARQKTSRGIPVAELDGPIVFSKDTQAYLKSSVYYDNTYLTYDDPGNPSFQGRNHIQTFGTENALFVDSFRVGASIRRVDYQQASGIIPVEDSFSGSVTYTYQSIPEPTANQMKFTFQPLVHGVGVTNFGFRAGGGAGVRFEGLEHAVYSRILFTSRFPTLLDRYSIDPGFTANAGVTPERDTTGVLGYEYHEGAWKLGFEGYHQWRYNVLTPVYGATQTIANFSEARIGALIHRASFDAMDWLRLSHTLTLTDSYLSSTGDKFPYSPARVYRVTVEFHDGGVGMTPWSVAGDFRASSEANAGSATVLVPGYEAFDLRGRVQVFRLGTEPSAPSVELTGQIENVGDRKYEVIKDYPVTGRTYVIGARGVF